MKKIAILLVLSVMTLGSAAAQEFHWGIKGGLNLATVTNSGSDMKASINFGGFVEYQFTDRWAAQSELVYSRQGAQFKDGDIKIWERMNYLNIPMMAKWYAIPGKLSIEAGPQIGFALRFAERTKAGNTKTLEKWDSAAYKTADFAIALGATYYITDFVGVNFRYNAGLTNAWAIGDGTNQVIQLGALLRF